MARVLVVDDEAAVRASIRTILETEGYEVDEAENGEEALTKLGAATYDLMLSDIRMTPMDGMELLKEAHKECPNVAVVMLTGYASMETATESLRYDVYDYIQKPFKLEEILEAVRGALEHRETLGTDLGDRGKKKEESSRTKRLKAFMRDEDSDYTDDVPKTL